MATRAQIDAHRAKMKRKKAARKAGPNLEPAHGKPAGHGSAALNRRTGKPHEHLREIARRSGRAA